MRVLVIGSGGREHALVWKLAQSPQVEQVFCAPGNGGIAQDALCLSAGPGASLQDPGEIARLVSEHRIDWVAIGPEAPLVAGMADELARRDILVAGPGRDAARLEGSKIFSKQFMQRHRIPTAEFLTCGDVAGALPHLDRWGGPIVLKADGLAAGKGVVVADNPDEARSAVEAMLSGELVGEAGRRIVLEQRLEGEEVSFLVLTDGKTILPMAPTQDHKRAGDGDTGPNTGGMGAYCDDGILSRSLTKRILSRIVQPTMDGLHAEGIQFRGVLYFGLMITSDGPSVLEYNVRFGDPEIQALLFRLETDLAQVLFEIAQGSLQTTELSWKTGASVCIVASSGGYPSKYDTGIPIQGLEAAEAQGAKVFHAGTAIKDGRIVTAGGRVLGVTAAGEDLATATSAAYAAVDKIQFTGMHYRRDIARKGLERSHPL